MNGRRMPGGQGPARGRRPAAGRRPTGRAVLRRWGAAARGLLGDPRVAPGAKTAGRSGPYGGGEPAGKSGTGRGRDSGTAGRGQGLRRMMGPARRVLAPRARVHVSGRAAVLGVLLLVLTLAYADRLRIYLAQQSEIARLEADQRAQRERIEQLSAEVARWDDVEYVTAQARARLGMVRVGERLYIAVPSADSGAATNEPASVPWYQQVISSVQTADNPPLQP